jgi:hypothetical protein
VEWDLERVVSEENERTPIGNTATTWMVAAGVNVDWCGRMRRREEKPGAQWKINGGKIPDESVHSCEQRRAGCVREVFDGRRQEAVASGRKRSSQNGA